MQAILANWFTIGVILIILEMLIPGIYLMWFGVSALIVGLITAVIPMPMTTELILFSIFSILSVVLVIVYMRKKHPESNSTVTSNINRARGSELLNSTFKLEHDVDNGESSLKIGDSVWFIKGPNAKAGTQITIIKLEGNTLIYSLSATNSD